MTTSRALTKALAACAALALLLAGLASCGGGVETGGTGATGYVQGPVNGFGSVFVSGIRFDDSCDCVEDADGAPLSRDALRLGMVVEVESGAISTDGSGTRNAMATRIRVGSELLGPVTAISLDGKTIAVLGQQVRLTLATALDGLPGGVTALTPDDVVEVHGYFDAGATMMANYVATRIELRSAAAAYRVRGIAREIDSEARTLRIGAQLFDFGSIALPADGDFVRLVVGMAQVNDRWPVTSATVESRRLDDRDEAELEGLVTSLSNSTDFAVNGITVDASGASVPSGLAVGSGVKVRGRAAAGGVVATSVELRSDDDDHREGVDLRDLIADLDTGAKTFSVRGITVYYGSMPATGYEHGTEDNLANTVNVRVRGILDADRTRVIATRIEFVGN